MINLLNIVVTSTFADFWLWKPQKKQKCTNKPISKAETSPVQLHRSSSRSSRSWVTRFTNRTWMTSSKRLPVQWNECLAILGFVLFFGFPRESSVLGTDWTTRTGVLGCFCCFSETPLSDPDLKETCDGQNLRYDEIRSPGTCGAAFKGWFGSQPAVEGNCSWDFGKRS